MLAQVPIFKKKKSFDNFTSMHFFKRAVYAWES